MDANHKPGLDEFIAKPIVYGNRVDHYPDENDLPAGHTHKWSLYLRSTDPNGADELARLIESVTFRLHTTYPNPVRVCHRPPYEVNESGWGEFEVEIVIAFKRKDLPDITLNYFLRLFSSDLKVFENEKYSVYEIQDEIVFRRPDEELKETLGWLSGQKATDADVEKVLAAIAQARRTVTAEKRYLEERILKTQRLLEENVRRYDSKVLQRLILPGAGKNAAASNVATGEEEATVDVAAFAEGDSSDESDEDYLPNSELVDESMDVISNGPSIETELN